jgi:putative tricarboxylic transport membrane protein
MFAKGTKFPGERWVGSRGVLMSEGVNPSPKHPGFGSSLRNTSSLRGGLLVILLGVGLLVATFYVPSPMVPRVTAILLVLVGGVITAGLVPIRAPQDFYGGLALIMLATLALIASAELPGQRGFAFGPGTAPRLFAGALAVLGAAVAVVGLFSDGPPIERYRLRGPILVIAAILGFAAMIRPVGLIIASYVTFVVALTGSREMRVVETLIGAAAMTAFCVLLFVYLLNLPFQLWPRF